MLINFIIVAFSLFLIVKMMNKLRRAQEKFDEKKKVGLAAIKARISLRRPTQNEGDVTK